MTAHRSQLGSVVVADDFSAGAALALARAAALPIGRGTTLHLLHVAPVGAAGERQDRALAEARLALSQREAELGTSMARHGASGAEVR